MPETNDLKINGVWPDLDLERVEVCPYCGSKSRQLAHANIQDWSFKCSPGKWNYWECSCCRALYLDPRPTQNSIGRAYATYYTHGQSSVKIWLNLCKDLIRNQCYFAWYGIKLKPRISLPKFLFPLLSVFRKYIVEPSFIVKELNQLPKGRVVDVGCGSGAFLDIAKQFGWTTLGIELDPEAVKVSRAAGHEIIQATYEALNDFESELDCIICSHIIEHVHDPISLFLAMNHALKLGGVILLSMPNAGSLVRCAVSDNWRGLEAPRHLSIPRYEGLLKSARLFGFEKKYSTISRFETLDASVMIARQRGVDTPIFRTNLERLHAAENHMTEADSDFINVVFRKVSESVHEYQCTL